MKNKNKIIITIFLIIITISLYNTIISKDSEIINKNQIIKENVEINQPYSCKSPEKYFEIASECEAYKNRDINQCNTILDPNLMNWCKAKISKDKTYCDLIEPNYQYLEECYTDTAKNEQTCEEIANINPNFDKNECVAIVTKDISLCPNTGDINRCITINSNDINNCENLEDFTQRWDCKFKLDKENPNLCVEYHEAYCDEFETEK